MTLHRTFSIQFTCAALNCPMLPQQDVLHQARTALSVGGTTASSRSCSGRLPAAASNDAAGAAAAQGVADGEAAASALELSAAGSSCTRSPGSEQQELELEQPWMHADACSIGDPACMAAFQQRLSPLLLRRSISRLSEPPASPPLHASLQASLEGESSELTEEESWLLGSEPEVAADAAVAAGAAGAGSPAAAASVLPLDEMLLGSPRAPPAVLSISPTVPAGPMPGPEQHQEGWSPKATVASLADLRHSTPSGSAICQQRTAGSIAPGSSTTRRSKSAAACAEGLTAPLSARMLRQSTSLGSKKTSSAAPAVQGQPLLAAAARKAAAAVTPMAAVRSSNGSASVASVRSGMSTPSTSSRPNSARLLPGGSCRYAATCSLEGVCLSTAHCCLLAGREASSRQWHAGGLARAKGSLHRTHPPRLPLLVQARRRPAAAAAFLGRSVAGVRPALPAVASLALAKADSAAVADIPEALCMACRRRQRRRGRDAHPSY